MTSIVEIKERWPEGYELILHPPALKLMGFTKDEIEKGQDLMVKIDVFDDEESASGKSLVISKFGE